MHSKGQTSQFATLCVQHSVLTRVQPSLPRYKLTGTTTLRVPVHTSLAPYTHTHTHHHSHAQALSLCAQRPDAGQSRAEVPYHAHCIDVLLAEQRLKKQHCTLRWWRWWCWRRKVEMQGYIEAGMRPEKMRRGGGGISKEINKLRGVRGRNVCEG